MKKQKKSTLGKIIDSLDTIAKSGNNFNFDDIRDVFGMKAMPDNPTSKSPCGKCLGYECGCIIAPKRIPSSECKSFHNINKPIVITIK